MKPCIIGVSGAIAGGKTTVAEMFREQLGGEMFSADDIAHELLENGPEIKREMVERWGSECLDEQGRLSREKIAALTFGKPEEVAALNSIALQRIIRRMQQLIDNSQAEYIIIDAPLLFETGLDGGCDLTIFVEASFDVRARRVRSRGWDVEELRKRESSQMPPERKSRKATYVVNNDGRKDETERQVKIIVKNIVENIKRHRRKNNGNKKQREELG